MWLFSVLAVFLVLLILIDHLGSRRIRRKVRNQAEVNFQKSESAGGHTLRWKVKGAYRSPKGSTWIPLEAKAFFTDQPPEGVVYADLTRGLFYSEKWILNLSANACQLQRFLGSIWPRKQNPLPVWTAMAWTAHEDLFPTTEFLPFGKQKPVYPDRSTDYRLHKETGQSDDQFIVTLFSHVGTQPLPIWRVILSGNNKKADQRSFPIHLQYAIWQGEQWQDFFQGRITDYVPDRPFQWW